MVSSIGRRSPLAVFSIVCGLLIALIVAVATFASLPRINSVFGFSIGAVAGLIAWVCHQTMSVRAARVGFWLSTFIGSIAVLYSLTGIVLEQIEKEVVAGYMEKAKRAQERSHALEQALKPAAPR